MERGFRCVALRIIEILLVWRTDRESDAAVIVSEPRATTLPESWERLYDEPLGLLLNPAIAPADASVTSLLKRHPFIGFEAASLTGRHLASLLRRLCVEESITRGAGQITPTHSHPHPLILRSLCKRTIHHSTA